jgi:hypothetical protein
MIHDHGSMIRSNQYKWRGSFDVEHTKYLYVSEEKMQARVDAGMAEFVVARANAEIRLRE